MATLAERNSNWSHPNQHPGPSLTMQSNVHRQPSNTAQPPSPSVDVGYHHQQYSPQRPQPPSMPFHPQPQVQMQSPQWSSSPSAPQFYPQFQPFFTPGAPHIHPHPHPYYDPAQQQQQFAQWAYQQMLLQQQQQQQQQTQKGTNDFQAPRHRGSPSPATPQDFYQGQAYQFPPSNAQPQGGSSSQNGQHYQGFHPYRRPAQSRQSSARPQHDSFSYQPTPLPYVTTNDSSTSLDSTNSARSGGTPPQQAAHSMRPRTNSNTTTKSSSDRSLPGSDSIPGNVSNAARHGTTVRPPPNNTARRPSPPTTALSSQQVPPSSSKPTKPSPLSQESSSIAPEERAARRISRDDSELSYATGTLGGVSTHVTRTGGLKGRLRRALTMNSMAGSRTVNGDVVNSQSKTGDTSCDSSSPPRTPISSSPALPAAEPGRVKSKSLFNLRFNASTDNISLSSTVSSASVMIRKIGSMGTIARRSSIAGITRLFRDKEKKKTPEAAGVEDEENNFTTSKSNRAEASVSHTTVEFDKGTFSGDDLKGLSPAARLARQHTLKSKAAEAAKAEALAKSQRELEVGSTGNADLPVTWDRGTTKRTGQHSRPPLVAEVGATVLIEDDDESDSDRDGNMDDDITLTKREQFQLRQPPAPVDDYSDEDEGGFEEDVTVRLGAIDIDGRLPNNQEDFDDDASQWGVWRTNHKDMVPLKGVLRNAAGFVQENYLDSASNHGHSLPLAVRVRANSYSVAEHTDGSTPGPLAHIPSPDPDHIDGLHDHHHSRSQSQPDNCHLPDFSFEFSSSSLLDGFASESPQSAAQSSASAIAAQEKSIFNLPNLNSSAPVLMTTGVRMAAPAQLIQSIPKRTTFAANLSIYDTFSASIYDRRCEPATCNRLTPALAQRIKEELNAYKMEEMEVHVASRVHTHFFV